MHGYWDTNKVSSILFHAGADTSNKDDGETDWVQNFLVVYLQKDFVSNLMEN